MCCDGHGGFTTCYRPGIVKDYDDPLFKCLARHERDHVAYFRLVHPQSCEARPSGDSLFSMRVGELRFVECKAYRLQVHCLRDEGLIWAASDLWQMARDMYGCGVS